MKYVQRTIQHEHGFGQVVSELVVSDVYSELFTNHTNAVFVDVFDIGETEESLDAGESVYRVDSLSIKLNEARAVNSSDNDCIDFVLEAQTVTNKRYCALFINPNPVGNTDDAIVVGYVLPQMKAKDLAWQGAMYNTNPSPLREWELKVQSFAVTDFSDIDVLDMYDYDDDDVELLWEQLQFSSVDCDLYRGRWLENGISNQTLNFRTYPLLQLNRYIRTLLDIAQIIISDRIGEPYTITLQGGESDLQFSPVRYGLGFSVPHVCYVIEQDIVSGTHQPVTIGTYYNDGLDRSPLISERMVFPQREDEGQLSFKSFKNLSQILIAIGVCFSMYVEFELLSPTHVVVRYKRRSSLLNAECFIPDVTDAGLDTKPADADDARKPYYGVSNRYATEGSDVYNPNGEDLDRFPIPSDSVIRQSTDGERIPLTVSPTLWQTRLRGIIYSYPTNMRRLPGDRNAYAVLTTAIYLGKLNPSDFGSLISNDYKSSQSPNNGESLSTFVVRPAGSVTVRMDGVDTTYTTLSECLNAIGFRDAQYYETEYTLEVPYLMSFRLEPNGVRSWKHLQTGSLITLDGIEYTVVKIQRSVSELKTSITLHRASRFAFSDPTSSTPMQLPTGGNSGLIVDDGTLSIPTLQYVATTAIRIGDAVMMSDDGSVYRASRWSGGYGRFVGIALNDAEVNQTVRLQVNGRIESVQYSFIPGQLVHIRTASIPNVNLTTTFPAMSSNLLQCCVGIADTANSFVIDKQNEYVVL